MSAFKDGILPVRGLVLAATFVHLMGCGDAGPVCAADEAAAAVSTSTLCMSAHELARRSTSELNPTQAEINAATTLVQAGSLPLEAILTRVPAAAPWEGMLVYIAGEATDPAIAAAWRSGRVETGVERVDRVLAGTHINSVLWAEDRFATLGSNHAIAAGNVVAALADVSGLQLSFDDRRAIRNAYDLVDEGVDAATGEHRLRFTVGWYECDVECAQQYFWRVGIAPNGVAHLVEEWGDPMPDDIRASWYK